MQRIQDHIHRLTNHLQAVLGYMELEEYDKSLAELHETIVIMGKLAVDLCGVTKDCEIVGIEALSQLKIVSKTTTHSTTTTTTSRVGKRKKKAAA